MGRAFQLFFKMWAQRFSVSQAPPAMIHLEAWNKVKLAKIPFEIFHFKKIQVAVLAGAAAAVALTILVCSYFLWLLVFILHLTFCNAPLASIWCGVERRALYMLVMLTPGHDWFLKGLIDFKNPLSWRFVLLERAVSYMKPLPGEKVRICVFSFLGFVWIVFSQPNRLWWREIQSKREEEGLDELDECRQGRGWVGESK